MIEGKAKIIEDILTEDLKKSQQLNLHCWHCKEILDNNSIKFDNKKFCCNGCKSVYEILMENDLCAYYLIDDVAGLKQAKNIPINKYAYLEDSEISEKLLTFKDNKISIVTFSLPNIHCSSCVWLLERLFRLNENIIDSKINLNRKTITIKFQNDLTNLREVVETLVKVGYEPDITLEKIESNELMSIRKNRLIKLGVAGFCFGNIMMLSLPDYFSFTYNDPYLNIIPFRLICFILSLPVIIYCASEFYVPAIKGLKNGFINIDAPVFLAILVTFIRSIYEIILGASGGYFDSMSGIVFFMLLGRTFQDITYKYVSFDKSIVSFLPIAISKKKKSLYEYVLVKQLKMGDIILVRNEETCPTDGTLLSEFANIDYSFVTGESEVKNTFKGKPIYAGGKILGKSAEIMVLKTVEESYLNSIWINSKNHKSKNDLYKQSYIHKISNWFTIVLLIIAASSFVFWSFINLNTALDALTTILIVACPCVLLLSHTYTYGFISTILTRNGIYLKDTYIIDQAQKISHIVFDKTGTLTNGSEKYVSWIGISLSASDLSLIKAATIHSNHPKSKLIYNSIKISEQNETQSFEESHGLGFMCKVNNQAIKIGSAKYLGLPEIENNTNCSYVSINDQFKGYFKFQSIVREDLEIFLRQFPKKINFSVLSGDNDADKEMLISIFPSNTKFIFNALPHQKLEYIEKFQQLGENVAMIGDGINDSGALQQANIGISIAGYNASFVPACDVYVENNNFQSIPKFFKISAYAKKIVLINFIFALFYNSIGLTYAITGSLSPGIAAVLMPLSTITLILLTFSMSLLFSKRIKLS